MIGAGGFRSGDSTPVVLVPLAVSIFLIAGLRYLFSLPSELRANWIFQAAESEGRASWLRAVDRFVIVCGLVPVYACTMPAAIAVFGWWQALRVTALGLFMALLVFEFLFRDWHKAPFTCSYLPGKRQFWQVLVAALRDPFLHGYSSPGDPRVFRRMGHLRRWLSVALRPVAMDAPRPRRRLAGGRAGL